MAQEIITLENLAAEIAKLRGELATWKALAIKQDRLSTAQMLAVNSGATAGKIAQIATNTSDIAALQQIASSAFRVVKVAQLPASGEPYIMYLVPQTDGETLNYCNEYLWIDNAWELVGTTGAMANNGELQIIVNGVTVGTFTANQATNSTASITVPTDTSQLTNGAGYVDATALATVLASKQDSLSLTQLAAVNSGITSTDVAQIGANTTAIAGKQDALTTSQLAAVNSGITSADVTQIGTNTGNIATNSAAIISLQGSKQNALSAAQLLAVNSGITSSLVTQIGTNQSDITTLNTALGQSLTPSADDTYSLGGASFRYANVYAVTFTGDLTGTASRAIADEDGNSIKTGYVNIAGNQTATGQKTWSGNQFFTAGVYHKNNNYEIGNTPASNIAIPIYFTDKVNINTGYVRNVILTTGKTQSELLARNKFTSGALSPTGTDVSSTLQVEVQPDGTKSLYFDGSIRNNVLPYTTSTYDLGTSTNKWKTLNGINPGALSLPDLSSDGYVNLSSNISVNRQYTYTVPSDGWLCLYVQTSGFHAENAVAIFNGAGTTDAHRWANSAVSSINLLRSGIYHGAVSVPVRAGNTYFCYMNVDPSTSLAQVFFYFYKATGNV